MAIPYCPNKNSETWKRLVEKFGEDKAYYHWHVEYGPRQGEVRKSSGQADKLNTLGRIGQVELRLGLRHDHIEGKKRYPRKQFIEKKEADRKVKELNKGKLVDSPYKATTIRIMGEGGQAPYAVRIEPKDQFRQLSSDQVEEANEKLDAFLKRTLADNFGITVEAHETLKDRTGKDVVGVADIYQRLIQVSKGKSDRMTLPEETAHFLIEMMKDNKMVDRMKELAKNTSTYEEVYEEYKDNVDYQDNEGNPDTDKIAKEAAGKLLGEKIIKKYEKGDTPNNVMDLLRRIWDKIKSIFKRGDRDMIQNEIDRLYGGIAENLISGDLSGFDTSILKEGRFYRQGKNEEVPSDSTKRLNTYEDSLEKSINAVKKKIKVNRAKNRAGKKFLERENKLLKDLLKQKNDETYLLGNVRFLQELDRETVKIAGGYDKSSGQYIEGKFREIENEIQSGDADKREVARRLRDIVNYIGNYDEIIETLKNELRNDRSISEKKKEVLNKYLSWISSRLGEIKKEYDRIGNEVFKDFLKEFSTNPDSSLDEVLDRPLHDIGAVSRYWDSLANSNNEVLKIVDVAVKDYKERAREATLARRNQLLEMQLELEKAGITSFDFVYEKDSEGELTGNIISEVNWHEFNKAKQKFFDGLNKKYRLPEDKEENKRIREGDLRAVANWYDSNKSDPEFEKWTRDRVGAPNRKEFLIALAYAVREDYGKEAYQWFQKHQEPNPKAQGLIDKKKQELSEAEFNDWIAENIIEHDDGSKKYIRDLAMPSREIYENKEYKNLSDTKKKYIDQLKDILEEENKKLAPRFRLGDKETYFMAPQLRKDIVERARAKGAKRVGQEVKEQFVRVENELEFGSIYNLTDERGREIKMIPRQFTMELQDKRDLSTDITSAMSLFSSMANNQDQMGKISDMLELGRDVVGRKEFYKTKGGKYLRELVSGTEDTSYETIEGVESQTYDRLTDYLNMIVYGEKKVDEGTLFGNVDRAKAIDTLGNYTAISNLALNVYAGFANVGFGTIMMHTESIASEFISRSSLRSASKDYYKQLPKTLSQTGNRYRTDWMSAWNDRMNTLQNFESSLYNMDTNRRTWIGQMFKVSSLFFMNHAGEHFMQTRMSIALAKETLVKDKDGNIKTLDEASYVEGNELKFEEGLTKVSYQVDKDGNFIKDKDGNYKPSRMWWEEEHGKELTSRDIRRFTNKQNFINKRLHGIYNDIDQAAIQQYSLGRLALMFRKFMRPGFNRRFEKLRYNEEGEAFTEGYYRTAGRFLSQLVKDLSHGKKALAGNWKELSQREKANIFRAATEAAYTLAVGTLAIVLTNLTVDGDDEDEWALNMMAYQANRVLTELQFYYNPYEMFRILKTPAAGVDQLEKVIRVFDASAYFHTLERGPYKGWNEGLRNLATTFPLHETTYENMNPDEQLKFFSE